ncbi:MAG TPA: hypothetical protein VD813_05575 [Pseudonocardia sp.]|nr:hypothetical protein [Pseudonocardia sp.]
MDRNGGGAAWAMLSSAAATARLLAARRLALRKGWVGRRLGFADGDTAVVFRETVLLGEPTVEPATLVVAFRLRLVGSRRLMQLLFRLECIANTPLFAGFPGFRTKLWALDARSGVYRGVYQWDGAERAERYATALTALLRLVCEQGSVRHHVVPGLSRDAFLADPARAGTPDPSGTDTWWRLREPVPGPAEHGTLPAAG